MSMKKEKDGGDSGQVTWLVRAWTQSYTDDWGNLGVD